MATFSQIPGGTGMQPGFSVRRNAADTGFEGFDTAPFVQNEVSHNLDEAFQPSPTDNTIVHYSIDISCTSTLLGAKSGTVILEISTDPDDGFIEKARFTHGLSGIAATSNVTGTLSSNVPAGWYVRLTTSGNATISYVSGQEGSVSIAY